MPTSQPAPVANRAHLRHPELPTDRPWLIGEAADYLRVDARTVRRLVACGTLPVSRVPGTRKLLFDPAAVRQLVAANTR